MDKQSRRKAERILRDVGFVPVRDTTHGTFWRRGPTIVMISQGRARDPRGLDDFRQKMKRIGITI